MTNEQLALLLTGLADELEEALGQARSVLSEGRPGKPERVHVSGTCFSFNCQNPEHWHNVERPDPVGELDDIDTFLSNLRNRIHILTVNVHRPAS